MASRKNKELSLEEKIKLLKFLDDGNSERKAAKEFKVSKGTVSNVKRRGSEYLNQYQNENLPGDRCRKFRKTENDEINKLTWEWFREARSMNLPISGPLLQETAKEFAKKSGREDFAASSGWLDSFKKRHQIVFKTLSGESFLENLLLLIRLVL